MQLLRVGAEVLRRQGEDEIFIWFGGMMVIILAHMQPRINYVYLVSLYGLSSLSTSVANS